MCKFCEIYEASKEIKNESKFKNNYYAILQERSVVNGREKGILNHRPMKIKFCPVCGCKLTETEG